MRRRRVRLGRGPAAALSIVIAAAVSAGINIATSSPGWTIIVGVSVLVLLWAGLEWWRAAGATESGQPSQVRIGQRATRVQGGEIVGAEGLPPGAGLEVTQEVTEVGENGSVIGYRDPKV
ncbi:MULTISPECIES: hypothetical protein [unclassified Crossiella]|uniref:hypothetical protein n=1 Tax=unclassified Crossiella TaxID=2620835 RepID=UPI001FFF39C8|nr:MULTISPECIES: hypothetical protein [unclassified Crossiella]MCK2239220.1 hypothetical protein [Crossiella sp. S99.2]MCK2251211.1 hypothetical protein [Crossiella sp. S99.1]